MQTGFLGVGTATRLKERMKGIEKKGRKKGDIKRKKERNQQTKEKLRKKER